MNPHIRKWNMRAAVICCVLLLVGSIGYFVYESRSDSPRRVESPSIPVALVHPSGSSFDEHAELDLDPVIERFRKDATACRELFLKHRAIAKKAYHAQDDRALQIEEKTLDRQFAKLYSDLYDRIQALPKEDDRRAVMGGLWKQISE
jgi:hypothetical protein